METKKKYAKIKEFIVYYCHLHCTTIESDKTNKEGNKLKTAKCYSRVYYYKSNIKFLMDGSILHFNKLQIPKYENFADIEGEITNYNQFKKDLINYLNSPLYP